MAAADDKKIMAHLDFNAYTQHAEVPTCKNIVGTLAFNPPADHPDALPTHKSYWIVGFTTPDNTDYPDTVAPIGSIFIKLTVAAGAVTGSSMYLKTAATTWTVMGAVA